MSKESNKTDNLYAVRFNNGTYWMGLNSASAQIRKAKLYTSIKMAIEAGDNALKAPGSINILDTKNTERIFGYCLVSVSITINGVIDNT
ncbi:MAG: hypothetical protein IJ593_07615 [Lachnospiraceae bacterium]|nr:hypothetical protein [Lachnospiraceae bacterium]